MPQFFHRAPALAQAIAQCFNCYIESDLVALFEAIGDGFGGIVDADHHSFDQVLFHAFSQSTAREANDAQGG